MTTKCIVRCTLSTVCLSVCVCTCDEKNANVRSLLLSCSTCAVHKHRLLLARITVTVPTDEWDTREVLGPLERGMKGNKGPKCSPQRFYNNN